MLSCNRLTAVILALLLATGLNATTDDAASILPEQWENTLTPVPIVSLDNLDNEARDSILEARGRLNTALHKEGAEGRLSEAWGELGGLYQVHFVYQIADLCYQNAIQLDPGNFRWTYYSAYLAAETGRTQLAVERFELARTLKPGYKALMVRLADAYLDLNELDSARATYMEVVDAEGLEAASLYGLGQIALLRRDYTVAIDYFTRALEINPAATRIHYPLARALRATQQNETAKEHIALHGDVLPRIMDPQVESLNALKDSASVYFTRAMRAINNHEYKAAAEAFANGLEKKPDNALARISYARTLYLNGDNTVAHSELEQALIDQPDNTLGLFLLGVLIEEEGKTAKASSFYKRVLEQDPGHSGAHFYLANLYYHQGHYARASSHYAKSLATEPDNMAAWVAYTGSLLQGNTSDQTVLTVLEKAILQFPEHPVIQNLLIQLQSTSTDIQVLNPQAVLELAQQLADSQPMPQHRELLALACAAAGDFKQATTIQQELVFMAAWSMPGEAERLDRNLGIYREGSLPDRKELVTWTVIQPPAFQGKGPFLDYPAPRPY